MGKKVLSGPSACTGNQIGKNTVMNPLKMSRNVTKNQQACQVLESYLLHQCCHFQIVLYLFKKSFPTT